METEEFSMLLRSCSRVQNNTAAQTDLVYDRTELEYVALMESKNGSGGLLTHQGIHTVYHREVKLQDNCEHMTCPMTAGIEPQTPADRNPVLRETRD